MGATTSAEVLEAVEALLRIRDQDHNYGYYLIHNHPIYRHAQFGPSGRHHRFSVIHHNGEETHLFDL